LAGPATCSARPRRCFQHAFLGAPRQRRPLLLVVAAVSGGGPPPDDGLGGDRDERDEDDALRSIDVGESWADTPPPPPPRRPQRRRRRDTRVVTLIRSVPDRIRRYFRGRIIRQKMWQFISFGLGYYSGQVVSLEFGNLGVNDVVAGAMSVFFVETITFLYYDAPNPTLRVKLLNYFKLGYTAALMADALKLGG